MSYEKANWKVGQEMVIRVATVLAKVGDLPRWIPSNQHPRSWSAFLILLGLLGITQLVSITACFGSFCHSLPEWGSAMSYRCPCPLSI